LQKKYLNHFDTSKALLLLGNEQTVHDLQAGVPPEKIVASWAADLAQFDQLRRKYFLYQ